MTFNAMTEHYEEITVCGKPALFTSIRIKRDTVPAGLYAYDVRHDDECRGIPCEIAPFVMVNHWGTIILAEPLELPDDGRRYIDEETDWDYSPLEGEGSTDHEPCTTISDFMAVYVPPKNCLKDDVWTVLYQNQPYSGCFKAQNAVLSVSSVVLCWALKLLKQPDLAQTAHEVCQAYINNCLSEWDSSLDCNAKDILRRILYSAQEAGDIRLLRYGEVDSSYDPDRDIVQKKAAFLLKGSLLKSLLHEYAPGYSASDVISHLQSEHLLSEFSTAKKIRINNGTYVDARLLTLKRSCLTEYEDSD